MAFYFINDFKSLKLVLFLTFLCLETPLTSSSCSAGFYYPENAHESDRNCAEWLTCPAGWYCSGDGIRRQCPPGSFGKSNGLETEYCDGPCEGGYYCEIGTANQGISCPEGHFCPSGSSAPKKSLPGYYTVPNHKYIEMGIRGGAQNQFDEQQCKVGSYCIGDGTSRLCPEGVYGSEMGLSSPNCSGLCQGGYFCPPGSTSPTEVSCAHLQPPEAQAKQYCPPGSGVPIPTREGFYVTLEGDSQREGYLGDDATIAISFNISTILDPIAHRRADLKAKLALLMGIDESDIGRFAVTPFNNIWAVRFEATSSVSAVGFQTAVQWKDGVKTLLESSDWLVTSSDQVDLSVVVDSIRGVVAGRRTTSWGSQSKSETVDSSEPSLWHSAVPILIQFNISATVAKLDDVSCILSSNQTTHLKQAVLGALGLDVDYENLKPDQFAVRTASRTRKHAAHDQDGVPLHRSATSSHVGVWSVEVVWAVRMEVSYPASVEERDDVFSSVVLPTDNDEPGHMGWRGNVKGLKDGLSRVRYGDGTGRDGDGSSDLSLGDGHRSGTRVDPMERWISAAHSALAGQMFQDATSRAIQSIDTVEPFDVKVDLATVSVTSSAHWAGSWAGGIEEVHLLDFNGELFQSETFVESERFGATGFASEWPCPPGSYCVSGRKYSCPAGRYGARERSTDAKCDGVCHSGYYCPEGSISPNEKVCGPKGDSSVYCPAGSAFPLVAPPGYYTYGDTGSAQLALPWELMDSDEDGFLSWTEFKQVLKQEEARALWKLADQDQSDELDPREYSIVVDVLSPHGASARSDLDFHVPTSAHIPGGIVMNATQYSDTHFALGTIETRTNVEICDAGHYCVRGIRYPCPRGVYGAGTGLSTPACSGECAFGYYCPERSTSPRGDSSVTSPRRSEMPCGNDTVFCPTRSRWPQPVAIGYYTTGGTEDGTTRSSESRCDPGSYCVEGRRYPCLAGFFGESYGLTDPKCSGLCSAGFYCPIGSTKREEFPCGDPSQVCAEGSALPQYVFPGRYSVNGVCPDVWPARLRGKTVIPRTGFAVWTEEQLDTLINHEEWYAGNSWSIQTVVTSECESPVRFGFSYGEGSLIFTVPALATNKLIRISDEISVVHTPRSAHFQAFDTCANNITFHEMRIGPGVCPGFDSPALGECLETSWTNRLDFLDEQVRNEDTTQTKSSLITFLARSVSEVSPHLESPILQPNFFKHIPNLSQLGVPQSDLLVHKTWKPCDNDTNAMAGFRMIYNDMRVALWIIGEPVWWRLEDWTSTNVDLANENWPPTLPIAQTVGGVARRTSTSVAPKGHFAMRGLLYECPAGKYGSVAGMSDAECSGCCERGYYCPPASIHRRQIPCGGTDRYCPTCSAHPQPVLPGYYTSTVETESCPPGTWRDISKLYDPTLNETTNQQTEHVSSSLSSSVAHGTNWGYGSVNAPSNSRGDGAGDDWAIGPLPPCVLCPSGKYKATTGDSVDLCLDCDEATTGAISTTDFVGCECLRAPGGEDFEFLRFSVETGACEAVASVNETAIGAISLRNSTLTRFEQHPCERGFYCQYGVRYVCPSGRYGSSELNTNAECSGECAAGYFCPEGSVSASQFPCGGADRYCPAGSNTPILVRVGWYTNEEVHENIRSSETICPKGFWCKDGVRYPCAAGLWGGVEGLSTEQCSGECREGYYCPESSISPTQVVCGNSTVFCLAKASLPTKVLEGFYGTHAVVYQGRKSLNDPNNRTLSAQLPCEPGYYCSGGIKQPCRPGIFGWTYGSSTPDCSGQCSAGYRCPMASVTSKPLECAAGSSEPASSLFCPVGTADTPNRVRSGYYTVGGGVTNTTRTNEVKCEAGWWCVGGVKYPCPAGSYGRTKGLMSNRCSGVCPAGFACPEATIEPIKCKRGTYSTGGARKCTTCPGSTEAHKRQTCVDSRHCCGF